jgi:hypothetical protein
MPANPAHRQDPTFDLEAEQAVLGAFFIGDDTWQCIGETFSPEVFYLVAHQSIAAAIIARCKKGEPGDPVLIRGDLLDAGDPVAASLVFPLAKGFGTAANVSYYWQRLLQLYERRVAGIPDELAILSIAAALAKEETALEEGTKRIATGWRRLDRALAGGFGVPSLNLIGAAPKSGKSTWAQIVAERHAEAGGFVYYLDLENGRRRFIRRMLCRRARLGGAQVAAALRAQRRGVFDSLEQVERWREAKRWVQEKLGPTFLPSSRHPRTSPRASPAPARRPATGRCSSSSTRSRSCPWTWRTAAPASTRGCVSSRGYATSTRPRSSSSARSSATTGASTRRTRLPSRSRAASSTPPTWP